MFLDSGSSYFSWIVTVLIGSLTYFVGSLYIKTRGLPPGPLPLPIVGNLLALRGNVVTNDLVLKLRKKYGEVFTFWIGFDPVVVVCGWPELKKGLVDMKNAFSGRQPRYTGQLFLDGHQDVIMSDFSPLWETLRKMLLQAVRKYSISDDLPVLVDNVLSQVIPLMQAEKEPIDPTNYLYLAMYNILASTAFGKRYSMDDEEFVKLRTANEMIQSELNVGTIFDIYPILHHILRWKEKRSKKIIRQFIDPIEAQYKRHKETYKDGFVRDFTDACLAAKQESEREDKGTAPFFTDENMVLVLFDFFMAGTDTTRVTLMWILLYLCQYPDVQDKLREELRSEIGGRIPVQEDKQNCPFTQAVIQEVLRLRPILSFAMERKATTDVEFVGYHLPKGTSVSFHFLTQHTDPSIWDDPQSFRPERFLETNGALKNVNRLNGYLPFGLGRRSCPGERLAQADVFLILAGLLSKCAFHLPDGVENADLEPLNIFSFNVPKPFKLKVVQFS